jgi:AcrR family transcriptional regulator
MSCSPLIVGRERSPVTTPNLTEGLAQRAVERTTANRRTTYASDIERIIEAAYEVIEKTGTFDPSLREILRLTKLSTQTFYRYFRSKDELLLVVLDDGRRQIVGYLKHRMSLVSCPDDRVRAWIEGVLAQAVDPVAASRTRPFMVSPDRLAEAFPDEMRKSRDRLIEILAEAIADLRGVPPLDAWRDAEAVYHLTFGALHEHLTRRSVPGVDDVEHAVQFALRSLARPG